MVKIPKLNKRILFIVLTILCVLLTSIYLIIPIKPLLSPLASEEFARYLRVLDKYSFYRLRSEPPQYSEVVIEKTLQKFPTFTSYLFSFHTHEKKVTGLLNIPNDNQKHPVIIMVRGYVDKEIYYTGLGTKRSAEALAALGYITVAPDFLGYGGSDGESEDIFEARFEKPRTIIDLIAALSTIKQADTSRIGVWAHSNGGQIMLSVLEITQKKYPTVFWAPVTQAFPDSVLQYIDELPDKGEYIKKKLSIFDEHYQSQDYSIASYWNDIQAPLQFHQGLLDEAVEYTQTQAVVETLAGLGKTVKLYTYPGENHNFTKGSFDSAIQRSILFYAENL